MTLKEVLEEIVGFVKEDPQRKYRIIVSSDSPGEEGKGLIVPFTTAIIIHRIGRGGRVIIHKTEREDIYSFRDRIYQETVLSVTLAQELRTGLKNYIDEDYLLSENFEIHADVGENGKTRQMIREVVGMITGNGFNAKIKPEAPGIYVADRFVKPAWRIEKPILKPA